MRIPACVISSEFFALTCLYSVWLKNLWMDKTALRTFTRKWAVVMLIVARGNPQCLALSDGPVPYSLAWFTQVLKSPWKSIMSLKSPWKMKNCAISLKICWIFHRSPWIFFKAPWIKIMFVKNIMFCAKEWLNAQQYTNFLGDHAWGKVFSSRHTSFSVIWSTLGTVP